MNTAHITELLKPTVEHLGYEFWGCEFITHGHDSFLRIYIDKEVGVNVDDCAIVSRQVSTLLDVEDVIPHEYTLEVSSPGLNRPFYTAEQCSRFVGDTVSVSLRSPNAQGRRRFKGTLMNVEQSVVSLDVDGELVSIDFNDVDKAKRCV